MLDVRHVHMVVVVVVRRLLASSLLFGTCSLACCCATRSAAASHARQWAGFGQWQYAALLNGAARQVSQLLHYSM
jgi:hypothetical protein